MRPLARIFSLALPLILAAAIFVLDPAGPVIPPEKLSSNRGPVPPAAPGAGAEEGEFAERLLFDHLRLRDPATGRIPDAMRTRELAFARGLPVNRGRPGVDAGGPASLADKAHAWVSRGPHAVGGRVRALAIDLADPTYQTLLAGAVSGGLWRTVDDGQNWNLLTPSHELHNISCIAQDPRPGHRNVWYYGTGEGRGSLSYYNRNVYAAEGWGLHGNGIYKSVDGGLTWDVLPATSSGTPTELDSRFDYVWNLVVDPSETVLDEVYAAAYGVVYRSVDGGASWTAVLGDFGQLSMYADVVVADDGTVYAGIGGDGTVHGVFRSPDGVTWTNITPTPFPADTRVVLALAPSDQNQLLVTGSNVDGTYDASLHHYRYLSGSGVGDGGVWTDRSAVIQVLPHDYYGSFPYRTQSGYNQCIAISPATTNIVLLGGIHMWRSVSGFTSTSGSAQVGGWLYDNHHADVQRIIFHPTSSSVAYTASDGGVHKCANIDNVTPVWTSLNNGFVTTQYYTVAIDEDQPGSDVILAGTQDNGTHWTGSALPTAPWTEPLGGDGAHCYVRDPAAGEYYMSYYRANIFHYVLDAAGTEVTSKRVNPNTGDAFLFINPFVVDPVDERMMYLASSNGILRNTNLDAIPAGNTAPTSLNWNRLCAQPADEAVTALSVSGGTGRVLYYGTELGKLYRVDAAHTAPAGTVPVRLDGNAAFPAGWVSAIAIDPTDDQRALVAFSNYAVPSLWLTGDGGATWSAVEGNLGGDDGPSIRCLEIVPRGDARLHFAGTSTGLYSTAWFDGGRTTWTQEAPESIGNVVVEALAARSDDGLLVVATHGRGIFSASIEAVSDVPALAGAYLAQNAPNPFNPRTVISFRLPVAGHATLDVYDPRGRRVRRLLDGHVPAEPQSMVWDGCDDGGRTLAAGTYLYRLRSGRVDETRKMSLVK